MSDPPGTAADTVPVGAARRRAAPEAPEGGLGSRRDRLVPAAIVGVTLVAVVAAIAVTPNFASVDNVRAILRNASIVGIVAVAMTPITLSGNFLSLGTQQSAMAASVGFVALLANGWSAAPAILAIVGVLVLIGILQGLVVAAGLNPIITTLAVGAIVFGVVADATNGGIVRAGDNAVTWGNSTIVGIPLEVGVFLIFAAAVSVFMAKTVTGRETILSGSNRLTAEVSGISFRRVTVVAFVIFSIGLAIAGVLNGAGFGQATVNSFNTLTIDVVAAILVGGTAIAGGYGSPLRSAAGAVLIAVISNIMVLNDFSTGGRLAVQGTVVVAVVILLELLRRNREVTR